MEDAAPLELVEQPGQPRGGLGGAGDHGASHGGAGAVSRPARSGVRASIPRMVSFRPSCETASPGGQRHRRLGGQAPAPWYRSPPASRRSPCRSSCSGPCCSWPAGAVAAVGGVLVPLAGSRGSQDRPRRHHVHLADGRLRPHRGRDPRAPRRRPARRRDVRPDPAGPGRRDDVDRGQDVLGERGLRPDRDPLGRRRHADRQGARRLDDHPAARPQPAPAGRRPPSAASTSARPRRSSSRSA